MNDDSAVLEEAAALLNSLRGVVDGEAVDELDHALRSAGHAIADGSDDELVLASALHYRVAQQWLTPRFGERVGWPPGAQSPLLGDVREVARRVRAAR